MSVDSRIVLQETAAWALLTEKQRMVLKLYSRPTDDGKRRSVRGRDWESAIRRSTRP